MHTYSVTVRENKKSSFRIKSSLKRNRQDRSMNTRMLREYNVEMGKTVEILRKISHIMVFLCVFFSIIRIRCAIGMPTLEAIQTALQRRKYFLA
jgi:hypothetical protein